MRNMKNGEKSVASVDGLYRSVRKVIEEGRKVVSIAANAVLVRQTNLKYMRQFYLAFPIGHALRDELGWTHYRILMREDDPIAREWYMNECVAGGWSSRDLDRQVSTDAYHRRLAAANPDRRRKQKELPLTEWFGAA